MADVVKYGVQISNRIFVGGVAFDTKEDQLKNFFSQYGKIRECKIIKDSQNISRGFAFVTFDSKHDAFETQQLGTVFFNQKKLNLGPAIRQKGVMFDGSTKCENEPVLSTGVTISPSGVWYFDNSNPPASKAKDPGGATSPRCSATLVHKVQQTTQEYQTVSPVVAGCIPIEHVGTVPVEYAPAPLPYPHPGSGDPAEIYHHHPPQFTTNHGLNYGYHSQPVSSDIHVSFQNMTISPRPTTLPPVPSHHIHLETTHNTHQPVYPSHMYPYGTHIGPALAPHPSVGQGYVPNHVYDTHVLPVYDFYHPTPVYQPRSASGPYLKKNSPHSGSKRRERPPRRNESSESVKAETE